MGMQDTLERLGVPKKARVGVVREVQVAVLEGNVRVVAAKRRADGKGGGAAGGGEDGRGVGEREGIG